VPLSFVQLRSNSLTNWTLHALFLRCPCLAVEAEGEFQQLPDDGQYDQAGEWHAGTRDDSGMWQEAAAGGEGGPPLDDLGGGSGGGNSAGVQYICVRKQQAFSSFDPNEKGGRKTEKVKKGQTITAIETRELHVKGNVTLRIHYEGGWVSLKSGKNICFVKKDA
jgi:hypothetical protein